MGLRLHPVAPRQGWRWARQGFALYWRRPLAFTGLLMFFLFGALLLTAVVPLLGWPLGLALLPMLSLGFMIATRSALAGGPVNAMQLFEGLRHADARQRRAQWLLCAAYGLGSTLILVLAHAVDGGSFEALQRELAAGDEGSAKAVAALLADPRLAQGMLLRFGLAGLLSVPFWHAPALVHWGTQGVAQSLFSSTVAIWRNKAAFLVFALTWFAVVLVFGAGANIVAALLGQPQLIALLAMPASLLLSTVFYASLYFTFADCFVPREAESSTPATESTP